MAFKTYDELISMSAKDPEQAKKLVARAQKTKMPIVNQSNSGYKNNKNRYYKMAIENKMKNKPPVEEDLVNRRKQVGY